MKSIQFVTASVGLIQELLCLCKALPASIIRRDRGPVFQLLTELHRTTSTPRTITTFLNKLGMSLSEDCKIRWKEGTRVEFLLPEFKVLIYADPYRLRWAIGIHEFRDVQVLKNTFTVLLEHDEPDFRVEINIDGKKYPMSVRSAMKFVPTK